METLKTIYYFLYFLFKPRFWLGLYPVNLIWDKHLNDLMDKKATVTWMSPYGVRLDNTEIWVGNFPHAYGSEYKYDAFMPRRITRIRLQNYILADKLGVKQE